MFADEELHRHAIENLDQADALLFGRVTYEMMEAAFRPPARTGTRPCGGGVGTGTSRPNGIRRGLGKGKRRSPNEWAENRPPAQSNQRAEREALGTRNVTGIGAGRCGYARRRTPEVPGIVAQVSCKAANQMLHLAGAADRLSVM